MKRRRRQSLQFAVTALFALLLTALPAAVDALVAPNPRLTPGAIGAPGVPNPTVAQVCARGYAHRMRHHYDRAWRQYRAAVFQEYAIPYARRRAYTVDHLVPIELGGRAFGVGAGGWDLRNVWPQPKAEAKRKDAVEGALYAAVCDASGYRGLHLSLSQAQHAIAADWTHTPVGLPVPAARDH